MNNWQEKLQNFFLNSSLPEKVKVYLIGSRARKDNSDTADIDLGFENLANFRLNSLYDEIDKLNIALKVDLVDLDKVDENFYTKAKAEGILLFERS